MSLATALSLAPGFSRVSQAGSEASRFNGLPARKKPLKRFPFPDTAVTGLKPGANEMTETFCSN